MIITMFHKQNIIILLIVSIYSYCLATSFNSPTTTENYGLYDFNVSVREKCAGPKLKTAADYNITLSRNGTDVFAQTIFKIFEPTKIEEIRIAVLSFKDGKQHVLWNYRLKKPCQHFIVAQQIEHFLHSKNCLLQPGIYTCEMNYSEYFRMFFGTSFFYGEFIMKAITLGPKANIMCIILNTTFTKKKS